MFSIWRGNMHGYLSAKITCSKILTFSLRRNSRKLSGGGERGVRVSHFPYHVLPPPVLLSPFASRLPPLIVLLPSSGEWRGSETQVNFQTVPKLNILVHSLNRYEMAWHMPSAMLSRDLWGNRIQGISKFTRSNAVFPTRVQNLRFLAPKIYVFLLPKFSFKHWWMLNGNFKTLIDKCF